MEKTAMAPLRFTLRDWLWLVLVLALVLLWVADHRHSSLVIKKLRSALAAAQEDRFEEAIAPSTL
jgi:hypothetical protein